MSDLNAPDSAAEPAQEPEIECTFAHCSKKFVTFREMHRHKASAHEHYYCKKCDIDFSSDLKHIMHRVLTTDKHSETFSMPNMLESTNSSSYLPGVWL